MCDSATYFVFFLSDPSNKSDHREVKGKGKKLLLIIHYRFFQQFILHHFLLILVKIDKISSPLCPKRYIYTLEQLFLPNLNAAQIIFVLLQSLELSVVGHVFYLLQVGLISLLVLLVRTIIYQFIPEKYRVGIWEWLLNAGMKVVSLIYLFLVYCCQSGGFKYSLCSVLCHILSIRYAYTF